MSRIEKAKKEKKYFFLKKKKYKIFVWLITVYLFFFTKFFENSGALLTGRGYFIPKESSLFTFSVLLDNIGNGEYWLYGEDNNNYYYAGVNPYIVIKKSNTCSGFDKLNYKTWCSVHIPQHDGFPE